MLIFNNNPTAQDVEIASQQHGLVVIKVPVVDEDGMGTQNPPLRVQKELSKRGLTRLNKSHLKHILLLFSDAPQEEFEAEVYSRITSAADILPGGGGG
jgi:hypothetical protein